MLSSKRKRARGLMAPIAGSLAVALAVAAAGCSSDVTRFKLGGGGTVGSIPLPNEPVSPTSFSKGSPGGQGSVNITETDLSAAEPPDNYHPIGRTKTGYGQPPPTLGPQPKQVSDVAAGGTVEVQKGDTIYNLARRHGVAPAAIKDANNLTSDNLRPGQRLVIPGADRGKVAALPSQRVETREVKVTPIPVNPKPGSTSRPDAKGPQKDTIPRVRAENGAAEKGASEAKQPQPTAPPPQAEVAGKFRWPVRGNGRLIVGYGKRPDGTHNDGINLAVPHGTDVFAVESGKVAYAGSELKGYGNLILIRHSNKWVSAYAHADQVLVRSGDDVKKGQIIAKAGKTGSVDQPQLHFELRQDSRPVDPLPHLASAN